jgi:rare lipoprotein A
MIAVAFLYGLCPKSARCLALCLALPVALAALVLPTVASDWPSETGLIYGGYESDSFFRERANRRAAWRATVVPTAVRVADPGWTATVTFVRPEPMAPLLTASRPQSRVPIQQRAPITGQSHGLEGIASYYWQDQMTASGERFDRTALTAAHKTLPLNTRVKVTNVVNGRSVIVRINDRGPFKPGRVIDLSEAAARQIDMERLGLAPVKVEVVGK